MNKERLAAFTDGMFAVVLTVMVLELKAPHGDTLQALASQAPTFLAYVLSFVYGAIYWNNHHHFFALVHKVNGAILWANLHLLFWLTLIPFTSAWMGEHPTAPWPVAVYGLSLLAAALAWTVLQAVIIGHQGPQSPLKAALGRDLKSKVSPILYLAGIGSAFLNVWIAEAFYVAVALMWLVPDRRIERKLEGK